MDLRSAAAVEEVGAVVEEAAAAAVVVAAVGAAGRSRCRRAHTMAGMAPRRSRGRR
jgi:hypothetical protein